MKKTIAVGIIGLLIMSGISSAMFLGNTQQTNAINEQPIASSEFAEKKTIGVDIASDINTELGYYIPSSASSLLVPFASKGYYDGTTFTDYDTDVLARDTEIGFEIVLDVPAEQQITSFQVRLTDRNGSRSNGVKTFTLDTPAEGNLTYSGIYKFYDADTPLTSSYFFENSEAIRFSHFKNGTSTLSNLVFKSFAITYNRLIPTAIDYSGPSNEYHYINEGYPQFRDVVIDVSFEGGYKETIEYLTDVETEGYYITNNNNNKWNTSFGNAPFRLLVSDILPYFGVLGQYHVSLFQQSIPFKIGTISKPLQFASPVVGMGYQDNGFNYLEHFYLGNEVGGYASSKDIINGSNVLLSSANLTHDDAFYFSRIETLYSNIFVLNSKYGNFTYDTTTNSLKLVTSEQDRSRVTIAQQYDHVNDYWFPYLCLVNNIDYFDGMTDDDNILVIENGNITTYKNMIGYVWNEFPNEHYLGKNSILTNNAYSVAEMIIYEDVTDQCDYKFEWVKKYVLELSTTDLEMFKNTNDEYLNVARERYEAWAAHLGQNPYSVGAAVNSVVFNQDTMNMILIVSILAISSISLISYVVLSKKRSANTI